MRRLAFNINHSIIRLTHTIITLINYDLYGLSGAIKMSAFLGP